MNVEEGVEQLRKESEGKTDVCKGKRTANIIGMM